MKVQDYSPPRLTLGIVGLIAIVIPILLGYFLVSGLSTSSSYQFPGQATSTSSTSSGNATAGVTVTIPAGAGNPSGAPGYKPDSITVVLGVNSSVTWVNDDTGVPHTVTSLNVTGGGPVFDSSNLPAGQSFTYNFTQPGTYLYKCNYHSWMTGTVVVKKGSGSSGGISISIPKGAGQPSGAPGYSPDKITLVVGVNNTVTWTNNDNGIPHTVTSTSVPTGASSFDSGNMNAGATFKYTFTVPGTYQYHCTYHSWMTGTITVVAGP
jgi:plastocyanin